MGVYNRANGAQWWELHYTPRVIKLVTLCNRKIHLRRRRNLKSKSLPRAKAWSLHLAHNFFSPPQITVTIRYMFLSKLCLLLLQPAHTHDAPYGSLPHRPSCIACHEAQIRTAALRANASPLGEHLGSPHPQRTVSRTGNSLPQLKLLTRKVVILKLPACTMMSPNAT